MPPRLTRILACFASFTFVAPLVRAGEPAPLLDPPVVEAARAVTMAPQSKAAPRDVEPWERDDTMAHVSLAIGGVGFLAAAASLFLKKHLSGKDECRSSGLCQPRSREELTRDKTLDKVTAIGSLVGIAGGVTGALLLLLPKKKRDRKGVSAVATPSNIGIKVRF
ncbi:MAG TPA: hypothetical protein VM686_20330 [Polyangiaceae bacterium]|jgi:hypothetical protein|nr:hypothetical protein [Polyangiaceae bacterium]